MFFLSLFTSAVNGWVSLINYTFNKHKDVKKEQIIHDQVSKWCHLFGQTCKLTSV